MLTLHRKSYRKILCSNILISKMSAGHSVRVRMLIHSSLMLRTQLSGRCMKPETQSFKKKKVLNLEWDNGQGWKGSSEVPNLCPTTSQLYSVLLMILSSAGLFMESDWADPKTVVWRWFCVLGTFPVQTVKTICLDFKSPQLYKTKRWVKTYSFTFSKRHPHLSFGGRDNWDTCREAVTKLTKKITKALSVWRILSICFCEPPCSLLGWTQDLWKGGQCS